METILIAFDLWDIIEVGIQSLQSPEVANGSGDEESQAEQICKTQTFGPNLSPSQPKPNLS